MDEFISREATIKRIKKVYCVGCNSYNGVRCRACGTGDAIDIIEDAPAADVAPVVRCKDCKFSHADGHGRTCEGYWFELSEYAVSVKDDAFCSYGERRDDA